MFLIYFIHSSVFLNGLVVMDFMAFLIHLNDFIYYFPFLCIIFGTFCIPKYVNWYSVCRLCLVL